MKQKTAAIKFLRTKIAAGYVLILILIFSIVYIWFKEHHKLEEMKEASHKISCLRQNIHDIYVRAVDLSLIGETILNWDDEDIELYHTKRLEVDTLLYQFSSVYPSECIDSICLLLAEKEKLLYGIMQVLNEQEEIEEKIAKQVPVIARKSVPFAVQAACHGEPSVVCRPPRQNLCKSHSGLSGCRHENIRAWVEAYYMNDDALSVFAVIPQGNSSLLVLH